MAGASSAPLALSALLGGHGFPPDDEADASEGLTAHGVPVAVAESIIDAGKRMDWLRLVPATAGNLSQRLPDGRIAVTRSGCHKGFLTEDDVIVVDLDGTPLGGARPSAETLLHCQIYRQCPEAGAVLHGHSVAATILSRRSGNAIVLEGFEVLKAFPGVRGHAERITLPVFDNDQDIARLAGVISPCFAPPGMQAGYLLRGHGAYAWGTDMTVALARMEALEFLLECVLREERG
jgi:methylthioribulose-1-phosphate dehydratase